MTDEQRQQSASQLRSLRGEVQRGLGYLQPSTTQHHMALLLLTLSEVVEGMLALPLAAPAPPAQPGKGKGRSLQTDAR